MSSTYTLPAYLQSTDEVLLKPAQVQEYLGISRSTYYRLRNSGSLKGFKVSANSWRFPLGNVKSIRQSA